jgi:hypothetical protein
MFFIGLILGAVLGFAGGMILTAGGWRNALGKLGAYAVSASRPPAVPIPMPMARTEEPRNQI